MSIETCGDFETSLVEVVGESDQAHLLIEFSAEG